MSRKSTRMSTTSYTNKVDLSSILNSRSINVLPSTLANNLIVNYQNISSYFLTFHLIVL